jgi:hypothetical protein
MSQRSAWWVVVALAFGCAGDEAPPSFQSLPAATTALAAAASPSGGAISLPVVTLGELDDLRDPFEAERQATTLPPIDRNGVAFANEPVRS